MEKITSFTVNHNTLAPGLYLSRVDRNVYTYDLRFKAPNCGDYLPIAAMHTIEHLFATAVRNSNVKEKVVYFGPMGCRTGFYLLLFDTEFSEAKKIVLDSIEKCLEMDFVPGSHKIECGNYRSHNLKAAKQLLKEYLFVLKNEKQSI
jgi:S-ribosylhomocysteine lyase